MGGERPHNCGDLARFFEQKLPAVGMLENEIPLEDVEQWADGLYVEHLSLAAAQITHEDDPAIGHHDDGSHPRETDDIPLIPH